MFELGAIATCLLLAGCRPAGADPDRVWSSELVRSADVWTDRMNDAIVSAGERGLRVEIAPDRRWAIAAVPGVSFPQGIGSIGVRVCELAGGAFHLERQ